MSIVLVSKKKIGAKTFSVKTEVVDNFQTCLGSFF